MNFRLTPLFFTRFEFVAFIAILEILFSLCFPPRWYEALIGETNHIFLHGKTAFFNLLCIAIFFSGAWLAQACGKSKAQATVPRADAVDWVVTAIVVALICFSIFSFVNTGGFGKLLDVLRGNAYYGEMARGEDGKARIEVGLLLFVAPMWIGWLTWLAQEKSNGKGIRIALAIILVAYLVMIIPIGKRSHILRMFCSVFLVIALGNGEQRPRKIVAALGCGGALVVLALIWSQILRSDLESSWRDAVRYLVTSYNSQAMIHDGILQWPGGGTGFYWTQWIWDFPVVKWIPSIEEAREQVFGARPPSGLDERFALVTHFGGGSNTVISVFATSYVDLGWFGALPFFLTGLATGFLSKSFLSGRLAGVCLYPVAIWAIFEWRANLQFPALSFGVQVALIVGVVFAKAIVVSRMRTESE